MPDESESTPYDAFVRGEPNSVLLACPGSGKTQACAGRFIWRCALKRADSVAYLSYTRTAVAEARQRIEDLGGRAYLGPPNFVGTIDAFFQRFLFGPFIACVENEVRGSEVRVFDSIKEPPPVAITRSDDFKFFDGAHPGAKSWEYRLRELDGTLGLFPKRGDTKLDREAAKRCLAGKAAYLKLGFASHNDVLLWCLRIIKRVPRVAQIIRSRFGEIIIDEAQDTSPIQQRLFKTLEDAGIAISYVGDPDQSIFQFNDAYPEFLRARFKASPHPYSFEKNHRSSREIIAAVNSVFGREMNGAFDAPAPAGVYVVVTSRRDCLETFAAMSTKCGVGLENAALLLRDGEGVREFMGGADTSGVNEAPRRVLNAMTAFEHAEYSVCARRAGGFLAGLLSFRDGTEDAAAGWVFMRSYFPRPGVGTVNDWLGCIRESVKKFAADFGHELNPNLGQNLSARGFNRDDPSSSLLAREKPLISVRSVHDVKGETIEAVMLHGKKSQHEAWLRGKDAEMRCLAYVAMTRAVRLFVIGCETEDLAARWEAYGITRAYV
jgi:superfamily I DNA/RNA helicase